MTQSNILLGDENSATHVFLNRSSSCSCNKTQINRFDIVFSREWKAGSPRGHFSTGSGTDPRSDPAERRPDVDEALPRELRLRHPEGRPHPGLDSEADADVRRQDDHWS